MIANNIVRPPYQSAGNASIPATGTVQRRPVQAPHTTTATATGKRTTNGIGTAAQVPVWIQSNVTGDWTLKPVDVWHDRAVFHFLTAPEDRSRYIDHMVDVLKVNGTAIIATFAPDGPERCSGLPVARYSPETLTAALGERFELVEARPHRHTTPWGALQSFQYSRLRRVQ